MRGRWKESLGAPVSGFFGSLKTKSGKGRKKGEASSNIRRKKTWKVQKLKRARASTLNRKNGSAESAAGPVSGNR
jgi:hypothetical protein